MVPKAKAAGPWAPCIPVGFIHWLTCVSGTLPEAVPDVAGRACVPVYIDAYALPSLRTHPCMRMSRNASLPDLSALGVPLKAMGWRWETDIRVARAQARARCHTPVPSGRDTGRYDVLQMDTSVCFLGNKSAKMQRGNRTGVVLEGILFVCICCRHLPGCHDVWPKQRPLETLE